MQFIHQVTEITGEVGCCFFSDEKKQSQSELLGDIYRPLVLPKRRIKEQEQMQTLQKSSRPNKYRYIQGTLPSLYTYDIQADPDVPGGRLLEVHPAPVDALVLVAQVLQPEQRERARALVEARPRSQVDAVVPVASDLHAVAADVVTLRKK